MSPHRCTAVKRDKKGSRLIGVGTGYALSDDGLWRSHSWVLTKKRIIETTVSRVKYLGLALIGKGCRVVLSTPAVRVAQREGDGPE